jgi:hypothetical protein
MKTNAEGTTAENTANVGATGADVTPQRASSKKGTGQKRGAPRGQQRAKAGKPPAKPKARKKGRQSKPAAERPVARAGTARAKVIAMISRNGGATLEEICKATGWQKHTTRGLISTLGKRAGLQITSSRRESDNARVYEVAR